MKTLTRRLPLLARPLVANVVSPLAAGAHPMSAMPTVAAAVAAAVAVATVAIAAQLAATMLSTPRVVRLVVLNPVLLLALLLRIEELVTEELMTEDELMTEEPVAGGTMVPGSTSLLPGLTRSSINVDWHHQFTCSLVFLKQLILQEYSMNANNAL